MPPKMRISSGTKVKNTNLSQVFYSIFLTALIMSIFETVFAYMVVFPDIEKRLKSLFTSKIQNETEEAYAKKLAKQEANALLLSAKSREFKNKNVINIHAKAFAGMLSFVLAIVTFVLAGKIFKHRKSDIVAPTLHALTTVVILIIFQISFYRFGQKYKYMSPEQLQPDMMKELCANVEIDTEEIETGLKKDVTTALKGLSDDVINEYFMDENTPITIDIKPASNPVKEFMGHIEDSFDEIR